MDTTALSFDDIREAAELLGYEFISTGNWSMLKNEPYDLSDESMASAKKQLSERAKKASRTKDTKANYCQTCAWSTSGRCCDKYTAKRCRDEGGSHIPRSDLEAWLIRHGQGLDPEKVAKLETILRFGGVEFKIGRRTMIVRFPLLNGNDLGVSVDWKQPPSYTAQRDDPALCDQYAHSVKSVSYDEMIEILKKSGKCVTESTADHFVGGVGVREAASIVTGLDLRTVPTRVRGWGSSGSHLRHLHRAWHGSMEVHRWSDGYSTHGIVANRWDTPDGWRNWAESRRLVAEQVRFAQMRGFVPTQP
jgi:hypothetical protein